MTADLQALQQLWRQRDRVVLLQAGFGLGRTFLRTWQTWRDDAQRGARLSFIALEPTPPDALALRQAHHATALQPMANELAKLWPPRTRNLHRLAFDDGRVHLLLAVGEAMDWLPELLAQVDVFLIDAVNLSAHGPGAPQRLCKALARLAAPQAELCTTLPVQQIRPALLSAGFQLEDTPTPDAAATGTTTRAVYRPRFVPRHRNRPRVDGRERHTLIVGAGLAGCAVACALAEQGWHSTLIERRDAPAQEGSGNPAGLFHGIVNAQDGAHARFNRAAALQAQRAVQQAIDEHGAPGSVRGLLRLEMSGKDAIAMRAELAAVQLPPDYVQALDAAEASARCGLRLDHPAWFYPGGGWVQPAALARSFLQRAGSSVRYCGSQEVRSLQHADGRWLLLDDSGQRIAEGASVVLANASDALRLMDVPHWPVQRVRGQISLCRSAAAPGLQLRLPTLPLAGAGYLLPDVAGSALFGASAQPGDSDPEVRDADHAFNLLRLHQLSPQTLAAHPAVHAGMLQGRVGWRCVADDRLPLIGAAPDEAAWAGKRTDRLRNAPRRAGLYVFSALASRGIGWSALGGQVLAAQISGAPVPLEASLVDAVDPARFALRAARRSA